MCLNRKVIVGLAVVAVGVLAVDPHVFTRILPLLFFAICPLSMLLMMRGMSGNKASGGMGGMGGCSSMSNGNGAQAGATSTPVADPEVARLRAELDQLRAERSSSRSERSALGIPGPGGARDDSAIS
ncbi:MAG: hypothetical protein ACYCPS_05415 [Candidatus Saccharimonadales bacterium]